MTISSMKPSSKLLPRDAKIFAKIPDAAAIAYVRSDWSSSGLAESYYRNSVVAHVKARIRNVEKAPELECTKYVY